jgi:ABC-type cobalamin/Fe3+-siderophores transport system ATPase subunit
MLEIQSLNVRYGNRLILENVSLKVKAGEIMALIGPNGAGKTTLIRAVSGVLLPERGRILAGGEDIANMPPARRAANLAVVPQARHLPETFTVWETVLMGRTPYLGWLGRPLPKDLCTGRMGPPANRCMGAARAMDGSAFWRRAAACAAGAGLGPRNTHSAAR